MKSHAQNKGTENVFLNPKTSKDIKSKKEPKKPVVKKIELSHIFFTMSLFLCHSKMWLEYIYIWWSWIGFEATTWPTDLAPLTVDS